MNERKNDTTVAASEEYKENTLNYGEMIIEMVRKIDNQDYLVNIYYFVKGMYDKCKK